MMHPVSIGVFVVVLAIGMSFRESSKEEKQETAKAQVIKSAEERLNIKVECLNGIEYWMFKGATYTLTLTPKYSQGRPIPDTCEEK
jgi:hypothetical protein